ncbi:MAG: tetratricopeptide repeat protein [Fibromonadaceae bacterium]|jgi:tetratricopeptide (TPR) repeat protein|nr:tetratricopeptide repeat protein [Fibromonadaceae bacterium]
MVMRFAALFAALAIFAYAEDFFKKANELYDAGKYTEAVPVYRAAIKNGQLEPYSWFNLGNTLVHLGQHHVAIVAYKRAAELAPAFAKPWVLLGDISYSYSDYGQAVAYYGRALELGERNEHLNYAIASAYLNLKAYVFAEKYFEHTLNENPDKVEAWFGLAECARQIGDYQLASEILQKALQKTINVPPDLHYTLSYYYLQQDSIKAAIRSMENGLYLDNQNFNARRYLASHYERGNSPWMAIWTLEQGIALGSGLRELEMDLAEIYFKQKRYSEALEHYHKAFKAGNSLARTGIENVGHAFFNQGDSLQAEKAYKMLR